MTSSLCNGKPTSSNALTRVALAAIPLHDDDQKKKNTPLRREEPRGPARPLFLVQWASLELTAKGMVVVL